MPFQTVRLKPGINAESTPTAAEAQFVQSNLIRWRDGFIEKMGGFVPFYAFVLSGITRALHAWQDLDGVDRLAVGNTESLSVITNGSLQDLTPQLLTSDFNPDFSTTATSTTVVVDDPNITDVTTYDSVEFKTPVAIGGIVLSGMYPITLVLGANSYEIEAASAAVTTRANLPISNITQANPAVVTYTGADNIANGDLVYIFGVTGMTQVNGRLFTVANLNTGSNTFELSGVNSTGYTAYSAGGSASPGAVPMFTATSGSSSVTVTFQSHGLSAGSSINFALPTTVGGLTITGTYTVLSITDVDNFVISADNAASSTATVFMNAGQAELVYYITLGPPATSSGYGIGGYGDGGYGTGSIPSSQQTGTPITADDWSLDNWGEILLANPEGGGVYWWQPQTGLQNAKLVAEAPPFNEGLFVSMPAQILVTYGSTSFKGIGIQQDPLLVRWSDQENFFQWTVTATTQAGSFRIPTGSRIVGGLQTRNYACIWTDLDLWSMEYLGPPFVFGFNKIAANCGLIGKHAVAQLAGNVYWMGKSNFFAMTGGGISPVPCSVWDRCFQNLDTANEHKCVAASNTPFNELLFFFPSASGATGECDQYVKMSTVSGEWDYGVLARTAWIDQSVLGKPIAASPQGMIFTQEQGYDANTDPINASFTSGYWVIGDGEDFAFVDFVIPDFRYGTVAGSPDANLLVTFLVTNFPGETPTEYGPYNVDSTTKFISTRFRGRQMAIRVESNDTGSFWRLGAVRFRVAIDGRR